MGSLSEFYKNPSSFTQTVRQIQILGDGERGNLLVTGPAGLTDSVFSLLSSLCSNLREVTGVVL